MPTWSSGLRLSTSSSERFLHEFEAIFAVHRTGDVDDERQVGGRAVAVLRA